MKSADLIGTNNDALLLILDDDREACSVLERTISEWGMRAEVAASTARALTRIKEVFYNLMLLGVRVAEKSGIEVIPQIKTHQPDIKIIVMSANSHMDTAIQALKLGAFDLLEKPLDLSLLFHSVKRALKVQKTEREWQIACEDLSRSHHALMAQKSKLDSLNGHLMETNKALSVLAKNVEIARKEAAKEIYLRIRSLIIPFLEKLEQESELEPYHSELNLLISHMEEYSSDLIAENETSNLLTPSELRIAYLIRSGLTSESIARRLNISPSTVRTHRKNIRKKLGISNMQYCLRDYLRTELKNGQDRLWDTRDALQEGLEFRV
jgi:FixJ family two-component response regulator